MSRNVSVIGVGQSPVGEHWTLSLRHLALEAIQAAMQDATVKRVGALFVGNMLAGALSRQQHLGALLADFVGMRGIEAVAVEAADASGGAAFRQALLAVQSGAIDLALVVGVEKMTDTVGPNVAAAQTITTDADHESVHGLTAAAAGGLLMRRYMHENDVRLEDLAGFSVNAHANGAGNPFAMFQRPIKPESYLPRAAGGGPGEPVRFGANRRRRGGRGAVSHRTRGRFGPSSRARRRVCPGHRGDRHTRSKRPALSGIGQHRGRAGVLGGRDRARPN